MLLLEIGISSFGAFVTAAGVIVGILSWWLAKLLSDKKDMTIVQMELKHMKEELEEAKKDIQQLQDWYNRGRNN